MLDQAYDLRRLATEGSRLTTVPGRGQPALVAVAGGKGGVGTTAFAVGIAASLAGAGTRAMLIDADPRGGDAALRCGVEERYTVADLLAGRQTWAEVIEAGPNGFSLVAGARWSEDLGNGSLAAADGLLRLLRDARIHADVAVLDVGNSLGRAAQQLCQAADAIVMVTTPETAAVIRSFAAIKTFIRYAMQQRRAPAIEMRLPLYVAVNGAESQRDIAAVHYRLGRTCRRVLGIELASDGVVGSTDSIPKCSPAGLKHALRCLEHEHLNSKSA